MKIEVLDPKKLIGISHRNLIIMDARIYEDALILTVSRGGVWEEIYIKEKKIVRIYSNPGPGITVATYEDGLYPHKELLRTPEAFLKWLALVPL